MAVGVQLGTQSINQILSNQYLALRNACQGAVNFQAYITSLGTAGLQAAGYANADAVTVVNDASYMNTVAGVFFGTLTQATTFNFDTQLSGLSAGQ